MRIDLGNAWKMLVKTSKEWIAADPWRQSALIAYYAIFSIPGLLIIVIWTAGIFFETDRVMNEVSSQVGSIMGAEAASAIENLIANSRLDRSGAFMKIIGVVTLVFGATTLFFQLQRSLNYIWDIEVAPENDFKKFIFDRAYSLGLILVIAFLLLITLIISAVISVIANWIEVNFGDFLLYFVHIINFLLSLGIITLLFAIMYKVLPDVDISWKSVWAGALVTAVLFTIGKTLLGIYFGFADPTSGFGAAGTVILIMLWVNYSCLILFFGAEFTQVHAHYYNHKIRPSKHAKWRAEHTLRKGEESD